MIDLLAAGLTPGPRAIDGTLIRTGADTRRNYSGKHKAHGPLFLALTADKGRLL